MYLLLMDRMKRGQFEFELSWKGKGKEGWNIQSEWFMHSHPVTLVLPGCLWYDMADWLTTTAIGWRAERWALTKLLFPPLYPTALSWLINSSQLQFDLTSATASPQVVAGAVAGEEDGNSSCCNKSFLQSCRTQYRMFFLLSFIRLPN